MAISERGVRLALFVLGIGHLALGAWQALAPRSFYDGIAGFGPYNPHFIRDVATFTVALGVVLLLAAVRSSWRVPVLFYATLQYALHTINHVVDVGKSEPGWVGPADVVALAVTGALLAWTLRQAVRVQDRSRAVAG